MKIGEFSRRNKVTQDTIRHYVDMGLLVVEKQGCQYRFTDEDSRDIQEIVRLKQLDFSLTEIQEILCFHRLEGDKTAEYITFYIALLERKKDYVIQEQQKYQNIESLLTDRIDNLKAAGKSKQRSLGFPISSIAILRCPCCFESLDFSNGNIERNMILEADIQCSCGYAAVIEKGIYIDRTVTNNKKGAPTKTAFLEVTSAKYINFMYNGITTLIDYLQNYGNKPKYILELDHCVGRFLMQYIDYLPNQCTYILNCQDKERIANIRRNLMLQHEHHEFIFFCCDVDRLPLAQSTIDIMIDHGLSRAYTKSTNQSLLEDVSPLLKPGGVWAGSYFNLGTKCRDFMRIPIELRDAYSRNTMLEKMERLDLMELDVTDIGPVIEKNEYLELNDAEQFLTLYVGKKKANLDIVFSEKHHERKRNMVL